MWIEELWLVEKKKETRKTWEYYSDGQGSLACCDIWGRKESDMTE